VTKDTDSFPYVWGKNLPSSITAETITHHVRTLTTKHVDQFLTINVVISDAPAGHIFTEVYPKLDWSVWIYSVFIYLCTHGKSTFYTFLYSGFILPPSYWRHTLIINILNLFYMYMWWSCKTFLYKEFKYIYTSLILDLALLFIIILCFNSVFIYIMVSLLSLVCELMDLCT
jgi:hypothetical protein